MTNIRTDPEALDANRCPWANDPLLAPYHDLEWGVPVHDDDAHFELLTLEGAQAGLSWKTVLRKRDNYRDAFVRFDPATVAEFSVKDLEQLVANAGLIRHRGKLASVIDNARAMLTVQGEFKSFDRYVWNFVDNKPIVHRFRTMRDLPATSDVANTLSKDLKRRGFRFVGPTICYSYFQAAGLVLDHLVTCPRWQALC